ncbi:MAG: putative transcription regulator protein ThiJ/PfpI [Rhodospirillales bacterium]|nr:putative transcription regulator protein ThiJ/PfpI [Rhodospirillales bacterium]
MTEANQTSEAPLRVGMVLFPNLTSLDLIGPHDVLNTPRCKIDLLWHRIEPVPVQGSFSILPTATFADYDPPDILFVPGGPGQLPAMDDEALIAFVAKAAKTAKYITSVCTGSLILGAAGLLKGKRATSHWASLDQLKLLGAIPVAERVVEDGNVITGAGVTSGIDFALVLTARIWGEAAAKAIQLALEYDPQPPFAAGSVKTADPATIATMRERMGPLLEKRVATATRIGREKLGL